MEGKMIMGLILAFSATISQAQNNKFIPPDVTTKTHSFALSELQVDSVFIENLNIVLFDKNNRYMNNIISNSHNKSSRHFYIRFEKTDSLNYCLEVSLWDIPARKSIGFFEQNGFYYWFDKTTPTDIIFWEKSKKRFSYKEPIPAPYDPPFWHLTYDRQTGKIEIAERYCFE